MSVPLLHRKSTDSMINTFWEIQSIQYVCVSQQKHAPLDESESRIWDRIML